MLAYPKATQTITGTNGGRMTGGPPRGVIHTTETNPASFFTGQTYYHLQVREFQGVVQWRQFIDLDLASRALFNGPDPVQTNRMGTHCPNLAIVGYAKDSPDLSERMLDELAEFIAWCRDTMGIPAVFPLPFQGGEAYGTGGVGRLSVEEWETVTGWVGHQDVPDGNTHWDPGKLPTDKLKARLTHKGEPMTPTQARIEVATAWYAKAGVWMDGLGTKEDPQERLTRLAGQVVSGERTVEDIVQYIGRVRDPVPGEAVPAWVLDPTSPYAAPILGGSVAAHTHDNRYVRSGQPVRIT